MSFEHFDLPLIKKRAMGLVGNANIIRGHYSSMIRAKAELLTKASECKEILLSKKSVEENLQQIQSLSQAGSIDIFQGLTTEMLHEAMPDNNGYKVKFDLQVYRGVPALDIYLEKEIPNGKSKSKLVVREDIVDGQGGSISNVIVSALRIISLARTTNRRFIMLDEPDCWLDQNYLKTFASVIKNISHEIGIQTVIISHKHSEFFSGGCRIIEVCKDEANRDLPSKFRVLADDSEGYEVFDSENKKELNRKMFMEGIGIRYIRLINFMAFEDSTIDLCPSVNVIIGTNNYGKSILRLALKAVTENKFSDSYIRHGADGCAVEIGLEDNAKIRWEVKKVKSKKTISYTFFHDENDPTRFMRDERGGRDEPPQYIKEALGMGLVDNFDIHLTHQKSPLFVLDPSIPDSKRANILSLGRESDTVQSMLQEYKKMCSDASSNLKEYEKTIIENDTKIERIKSEEDVIAKADLIMVELEEISEKIKSTENLHSILSKIERCLSIRESLSVLDDEIIGSIDSMQMSAGGIIDKIEKTSSLGRVVDSMSQCFRNSDILSNVQSIFIPNDIENELNTQKTSDISRVAKDIIARLRVQKILEPLSKASIPDAPVSNKDSLKVISDLIRLSKERDLLLMIPEMPDVPLIKTSNDIFERLILVSNEMKSIDSGISNLNKQIDECNEEYNRMIELSGGVCPLCSNPLCKH